MIPHTMPMLIIVVIAHIVLLQSGVSVTPTLGRADMVAPICGTLTPAPQSTSSTRIRTVIPHPTHRRLQHLLPGIRGMNDCLSVDVKFGRPILIDPDGDGCLLLNNPIKDVFGQSLHVVFQLAKDVPTGDISKEENGCVITML